MRGPGHCLESSAPILESLYDSLMLSFHQIKAKRDKRHPVQHVPASESTELPSGNSLTTQEGTGQPGLSVLLDGVEVKTDEKRGRGLYATKAYKTGIYSCNLNDDF